MLDEEMMHLIMNSLKEVDNVQIGDVMVDRVGFKNVESALMTLKQILEQRHTNSTPLIHSIRILRQELGSWHAQESHQIPIDSFFHYA